MSERLRVAYLVKTFPRLSETFILNEILGVEELGLELSIFSLRKLPPEAEPVMPARVVTVTASENSGLAPILMPSRAEDIDLKPGSDAMTLP